MSTEKKGMNVGTKSFLTATMVIFTLMVLTYVLTFIIPGGEYPRMIDAMGNSVIDTTGEFRFVEGGMPFWKWLLSPFLVLGAEGSGSLIGVIIFLLVIGGVFITLYRCGLMEYMLNRITFKFGKNRYALLFVITLFFMALGSFIGSFEECIPMMPIVVALAVRLGWDPLTGMGMSLLATGCGFAAGVCNPFTVGVAQEVAGLPMFSGVWFRALSFVIIYAGLLLFLIRYIKKIEKPLSEDILHSNFKAREEMDKGLACFGSIVCVGIALVLSSVFIPAIQDYNMIIIAVMFLVAGILSSLICKMKVRHLVMTFFNGATSMLPAVVMILMANSIKYTLVEAHVLDTVLHAAVQVAGELPREMVILFIYVIVLSMNFFIPSGSAKAFLLMPLIVPIAQVFGISAQLCVAAFAFGDGFSNVFYPTNPVLLIGLGLVEVDYLKWVKWSWKFQLGNLILTSGLLLFGLAVGYC